MSHTPQEAESLWCPMVRIAQVGVSETPAAYNRVMMKMHVHAVLRDEDGNEQPELVVKATPVTPVASGCIGDKCAMWRWQVGVVMRPSTGELFMKDHAGEDMPAKGFCGLANFPLMVQS